MFGELITLGKQLKNGICLFVPVRFSGPVLRIPRLSKVLEFGTGATSDGRRLVRATNGSCGWGWSTQHSNDMSMLLLATAVFLGSATALFKFREHRHAAEGQKQVELRRPCLPAARRLEETT